MGADSEMICFQYPDAEKHLVVVVVFGQRMPAIDQERCFLGGTA